MFAEITTIFETIFIQIKFIIQQVRSILSKIETTLTIVNLVIMKVIKIDIPK